MPADSRIDLLLAKAEPIKDGSPFGITDLTRGKKQSWKRSLDRGMRTCEGNNPANSKNGKEEGRRDSPGAGVEIPLQPILQTTVQQVFSLKPMEDHEDVEIHLHPMENPMVYQVQDISALNYGYIKLLSSFQIPRSSSNLRMNRLS
ncbi:hypothetical protein HGM15179_004389 [Zosterops borbonicus]|uniref:Uncharacterized protein n=1 Tax=Zosterops borbonicus TaxID=364589 RepID=A0A8K1LQY1_9PASS|nr:hypothetical protein HGM15179_004389 [Zosterops borbonicus]